MLILLSPAKTMDLANGPKAKSSMARSLKMTEEIIIALKSKSKAGVKKLMTMSQQISDKAYLEYQNLNIDQNCQNCQSALFAYTGAGFIGVDPNTLSPSDLNYTQKYVRILSGLYGALRPLDLIQQYRLEMQAKLLIKRKYLYAFWKPEITQMLIDDIRETKSKSIVNLLSNEYFKVIDVKKIDVPIINVQFKTIKNGQLKFLSYDAKKARGQLCRYLVVNKIKTRFGIQNFDIDGYKMDQKLSTEYNIVFTRSA